MTLCVTCCSCSRLSSGLRHTRIGRFPTPNLRPMWRAPHLSRNGTSPHALNLMEQVIHLRLSLINYLIVLSSHLFDYF